MPSEIHPTTRCVPGVLQDSDGVLLEAFVHLLNPVSHECGGANHKRRAFVCRALTTSLNCICSYGNQRLQRLRSVVIATSTQSLVIRARKETSERCSQDNPPFQDPCRRIARRGGQVGAENKANRCPPSDIV